MTRERPYVKDLSLLRDGQLSYTEFFSRHQAFLMAIAGFWHRRLWGRQIDIGDLAQEIAEALWRSVDSYDPRHAVPLHNWVLFCVRQRMVKRVVRFNAATKAERRYHEEYGVRNETTADEFHADPEAVVIYKRRLTQMLGSLDVASGDALLRVSEGERISCDRRRSALLLSHVDKVSRRLDRIEMLWNRGGTEQCQRV